MRDRILPQMKYINQLIYILGSSPRNPIFPSKKNTFSVEIITKASRSQSKQKCLNADSKFNKVSAPSPLILVFRCLVRTKTTDLVELLMGFKYFLKMRGLLRRKFEVTIVKTTYVFLN